MKKNTFLLMITLSFGITAVCAQSIDYAHTQEQQNEAIEMAELWLSKLAVGMEIKKVMSISSVPFSVDGRKILKTRKELQEFYMGVVKDKGQREFPDLSSEIYKSYFELVDKAFPLSVITVMVSLESENDQVLVSIQFTNEGLKVIGFID